MASTALSHPERFSLSKPGFRFSVLLVVGVVFLEFLLFSLRFDAQALFQTEWGPILVPAVNAVPKIATFALVILILLRQSVLKQTPDTGTDQTEFGNAYSFVAVGVHLLGLVGLYWLSGQVLEAPNEAPVGVAMLLAWMAAGCLSLLSAVAIVLPIQTWLRTLWNWRSPLALVLCLAVLALLIGRIAPLFWEPMARAVFFLVEGLLRLWFSDVVVDPTNFLIGTERFSVIIAAACSGYEGIGLILMFVTAYLWLSRSTLRFPRALLLLPIGVVLIWLANVLRIAILIAIGTLVSERVAAEGFHSQAGWLAFNAVGLGLVYLAHQSRWIHKTQIVDLGSHLSADASPDVVDVPRSATAAYLTPLLAIVLATMVGAAFSTGFDRYYALRVVLCSAALWHYRADALSWWNRTGWRFSWDSVGIGIAVFAIWMVLEPTPVRSPVIAEGLSGLSSPAAFAWLAFRVIGSVFLVPIAEELAFRGYLPRRLMSTDFESIPVGKYSVTTFLLSSLIFGMMHGRMIAGTLAGFGFAFAASRRGQLGDAIIAHSVANALIAILVLAMGWTTLWS